MAFKAAITTHNIYLTDSLCGPVYVGELLQLYRLNHWAQANPWADDSHAAFI